MKKVLIMFSMVLTFMGITSLYGEDLSTMKKNIKNRADKHILNIKNFEDCVAKTTKMEQIKVCKQNMEKTNIEIQQLSVKN